jgi:hypothetical protein
MKNKLILILEKYWEERIIFQVMCLKYSSRVLNKSWLAIVLTDLVKGHQKFNQSNIIASNDCKYLIIEVNPLLTYR